MTVIGGFHVQVVQSVVKAREVFTTALDHLPTSKILWEVC